MCFVGVVCRGQQNGCCTVDTPCELGEGDCDNDNHCMAGLSCGKNNCAWGGTDDCCYDPTSGTCSRLRGCCVKLLAHSNQYMVSNSA